MKLKAQNPYSQTTDPVSWHGWEAGFASTPKSIISPQAEFGPRYEQAFYRGQGAQIVKNYKEENV